MRPSQRSSVTADPLPYGEEPARRVLALADASGFQEASCCGRFSP